MGAGRLFPGSVPISRLPTIHSARITAYSEIIFAFYLARRVGLNLKRLSS